MLYFVFLILALAYNCKKFYKERDHLFASIKDAKNTSHREMILSHHFYIFIFECFLSLIVAHIMTEKAMAIGLLGLGVVYLCLLFLGFFLFRFFIRYLERQTDLVLMESFKNHLIKELRVSLALIMLPIFIYSLISWTFQDGVVEEWGNLWIVGLVINIIFVSVLTIACTVIIMLKLIPNREITEPEYLEAINKRLVQIGSPALRVRWIESDIKNAFVVGLKLLRFSNQTMFVGRALRTTLTMEEFDAVICHELSHVVRGHAPKRILDLLKNMMSIFFGILFITLTVIGVSYIYWGEDLILHADFTAFCALSLCAVWFVLNYALLFDGIRAQEYESDGYAVLELGASLVALESALVKLSAPEEMPEYLRVIQEKNKSGSPVGKWLKKYFSTHPDHDSRMSHLKAKVEFNQPFDHYISPVQKVRSKLGFLLNWKISLPVATSCAVCAVVLLMKFQEGQKAIAFIEKATPQAIMRDVSLITHINSAPLLIGHSLMYYVVKRKDQTLIDHFLNKGASKGRTLVYITTMKDFDLLKRYYESYKGYLSEDEYFLVLRKTAQINFTDGYRYLVNAESFEGLNPRYKEDLSRFHQKGRLPASVKK